MTNIPIGGRILEGEEEYGEPEEEWFDDEDYWDE